MSRLKCLGQGLPRLARYMVGERACGLTCAKYEGRRPLRKRRRVELLRPMPCGDVDDGRKGCMHV